MNVFNTLKSAINLDAEQKKVVSETTKTCKATAIIVAKRLFRIVEKVVAKLLAKVHLDQFAKPVTVLLFVGVIATVLQSIPGFQDVVLMGVHFLSTVLTYAIVAVVVYKIFRFVRRCYAEAKAEEAAAIQPKTSGKTDGQQG